MCLSVFQTAAPSRETVAAVCVSRLGAAIAGMLLSAVESVVTVTHGYSALLCTNAETQQFT